LYSTNQVLINGTAVAVGANPTAVAAYTGPVNAQTSNGPGGSCDTMLKTISGATRALVANSGANTVSVVDTVNDDVASTVTVGKQPVALVVNSAGTEAYVANYTDKTVTPVNLSAGTTSASIAVGGQPTSVALTSGGILWVGGVGFLSEINTSTMAVVATETVPSKNIVGLAYSDAENKIIATTLDASGNVYVDEVMPSSIVAGGTYSPAASTAVSTLGTHLNQKTGAEVQAFTATLASASILNTNQIGAPPLVVQDGWAVVTATPTGFTISDASGNNVLISEKTPSPITAIAVDAKLNVVYLTMPDSNTLLKVPLPGTN
jgi:YVTN family beta-propeller protein